MASSLKLTEPRLTGAAKKHVHYTKVDCVELTDDLLDQAVGRIAGRYDTAEADLIA